MALLLTSGSTSAMSVPTSARPSANPDTHAWNRMCPISRNSEPRVFAVVVKRRFYAARAAARDAATVARACGQSSARSCPGRVIGAHQWTLLLSNPGLALPTADTPPPT